MAESDTVHWNFLTNHSHVLICLSRDGEQPLRKVAAAIGITERAVQRIVAELEEAGYLERERSGRQNRYRIQRERRMRHALDSHRTIGHLLDLVAPKVNQRIDVGGHGSEI